jgi:sulfhydrogenase subunit alpha
VDKRQLLEVISALLDGREIHPINVRIGGFYRTPSRADLEGLKERLLWAREAALETLPWVAGLPFPDFERDCELLSSRHPVEYPMNKGVLVSSRGWSSPIREFESRFLEEQVPYSNALHARLAAGGRYLVGPLARYNLNFDRLSPLAQEAAHSAGLSPVCRNPFQSIIVRNVEILYACDEALRLVDACEFPQATSAEAVPRAATGCSCTEAPRGILFHRYRMDARGCIVEARIVPPTSQNQKMMEDDLREMVTHWHDLPEDELTWRCAQAIRNYDPCISCATH